MVCAAPRRPCLVGLRAQGAIHIIIAPMSDYRSDQDRTIGLQPSEHRGTSPPAWSWDNSDWRSSNWRWGGGPAKHPCRDTFMQPTDPFGHRTIRFGFRFAFQAAFNRPV